VAAVGRSGGRQQPVRDRSGLGDVMRATSGGFGMARASWIAVRRAGMKFHPARAGKAASVSMSTRIGIMSLAGQPAPASRTGAVVLTGDRDLCRDDLRLQDEGELLRLGETEPEVGQTSLLIAFDACHLDLRRLSGLQRHHQPDPHTQFRHQLTLVPRPETYRGRNKPTGLHRSCLTRRRWLVRRCCFYKQVFRPRYWAIRPA
jgi:hypothetical protein